ncbi:hypothetical protein ACJ73_08247 [Blastomyces percursus]|uniref:Uncharacterized protein n=1 Tax=Blastomyces percursus TaxID=1658174 RepID=A0A1J9QJQ6_9EURO|nr:hypothetical protein ACJ73_08247 [Blastomyces percursus]
MDNNPPTPPPHQQVRQSQSSQWGSREKGQMPQPLSSSPNSEPASQISSMTSRIQGSASGLLQNTLSAPSSRSAAHDIASTLAAGLGSSDKGSSSSHAPLHSGSSTPGTIPQSHRLNLGQPSSRAGEAPRFPSESFRSAPSSAAPNLYYDDTRVWDLFQDPPQNNIINDSNDSDALLLDPYDASSGKGKGKLRTEEPVNLLDPSTTTTATSSSASLEKHLPDDSFDKAWHNSTPSRNHNHSQNQRNNPTHDLSHHTPYTPLSTDGQAVVALLSSSTFQPATFTPPESPRSELFELDASMLQQPPTFSSSSISSTSLPNPLPTTTTTITTTQTPSFPPNQLSLIPDINSILAAIQQQQQSHPHARHSQYWEWDWREMPGVAEWLEVDGTYQDTVWGFLKPYVEAARKEIIERREEGGGEGAVDDGPAVKRLGMVMRHLRARL